MTDIVGKNVLMKSEQKSISTTSDVVLYKCNKLFAEVIEVLLVDHPKYQYKSTDCLERLEEHISAVTSCILVIEGSRLSDVAFAVGKLITSHRQIKPLVLLNESKVALTGKLLGGILFWCVFYAE
jgi:hypothetical protein